jgi:hypothetical protein
MLPSQKKRNRRSDNMEAVAFTLIGTREERFVPEPAEFRPFEKIIIILSGAAH